MIIVAKCSECNRMFPIRLNIGPVAYAIALVDTGGFEGETSPNSCGCEPVVKRSVKVIPYQREKGLA